MCFAADREDRWVGVRRDGSAVVVLSVGSGVTASLDLILAAVGHRVCELGILIHRVVVRLDAVGVVDGELCGRKVSLSFLESIGVVKLTRVVGSLDGLIDDSVANAQSVEVESNAGNGSVANQLVVLVEVLVEGWAVVSENTRSVEEAIDRHDSRPGLTLRSSQLPS